MRCSPALQYFVKEDTGVTGYFYLDDSIGDTEIPRIYMLIMSMLALHMRYKFRRNVYCPLGVVAVEGRRKYGIH